MSIPKLSVTSPADPRNGSAIVAVLSALGLLSLLLLSLLHSVRMERASSSASASEEQARLAAESGTVAARALLSLAGSGHPAFLVGLHDCEDSAGLARLLVAGATNLTSEAQLLPLFSCDLKLLESYPQLPNGLLESILRKRLSTNPAETVDLNASDLRGHHDNAAYQGGLIAPNGSYPALWQALRDSNGRALGRYAFILTDESARLNPALHLGNPRNDPMDWDHGAGELPLGNGTSFLPDEDESLAMRRMASNVLTEGSYEAAFADRSDYREKRFLLTRDQCREPDLIPPGLPEGGLPKYNLNDLATNPVWGSTPYARAEFIASVIDRNLPLFKLRDPSLSAKGDDPALYLRRLACSLVDYISGEAGPTGPPGGEPSGRDLVPYVTQIAERITRTALTSNSVTIESRFYAEVWNPTTSTIPSGGVPRLLIGNRARVLFGTGLPLPFRDYDVSGSAQPALRPNELTVVAFDPVVQTWVSAEPTLKPPSWANGPAGNADPLHHQTFEFFWNGRLVDLSRRPPISPGTAAGGLSHLAQTLQDGTPRWQCLTIPTWSSSADQGEQSDGADEAIQPGKYRFVGDPRANFLTAYTWSVATNYVSKTLWKGINPASIFGRGFVMDPLHTWTRRDQVPVNPPGGVAPSSAAQSPDMIPSPYLAGGTGSLAPFVIRKGPMLSLGELGNVFDPAQADDLGNAPLAGSPKSRFCSGGGRTLRIGQPEFHVQDPAADWDLPGKRAVELLDLFTLADQGRQPGIGTSFTNSGIPGRINVNTASHAVLTTLFYGIQVASDSRFSNSVIGSKAADQLATLLEEHRPYGKLSDLRILTPLLCDADTFTPPLSVNLPGSSPPLADVFDRAREEAFGKFIGHCVVQSRTFRIVVLGEALDRSGRTTGRAIGEGIIRLAPDTSGRLITELRDVRWH